MSEISKYSCQDIDQNDSLAVLEVLNSDFLTQGPKVAEFEAAVNQYTKSKFSVSYNSATSALHAACLALGISSGDIVRTSPLSFVYERRGILRRVNFVDIDPVTRNICPQILKEEEAEKSRKFLKRSFGALRGLPCDLS